MQFFYHFLILYGGSAAKLKYTRNYIKNLWKNETEFNILLWCAAGCIKIEMS
jgi:hypothetical protein